MNAKQRLLAEYTRRVVGSTARLEAAGGLTDFHLESASGALESALNDRAFRHGQDHVLEAIVLPQFRPALFIKEDAFDTPPDPWAHLAIFREALKPVIRAIGRVEVQNAGVPFGGTGFLCGPGRILTNRHVAEIFTHGVGGPGKLRFLPGRTASLDTGRERTPCAGIVLRVVKPLMVHPHWDAALLEVAPDDPSVPAPAPLALCSTEPGRGGIEGREVVVIGFPYWSDGHDPGLMKEVFGGVYGVKRLQPGKLIGSEGIVSFAHLVEALSHDSSTLGGNSGSAVIDLETQQVLALHFSGTYLKANYAVPMWELARDARVVDAGVGFVPAPAGPVPRTVEAGAPVWISAWQGREESPTVGGEPVPAPPTPAPPGTSALPTEWTGLIDPGWFERCSDDELRRMYQRAPEQTRSLIAASHSAEEAQEIYDTVLLEASTEGVHEAAVDPSLPEIVLMPGLMGSHLRGPRGSRAWLNLLMLPFSNLLGSLGLDRNGNDPNALSPDGHVASYYARTARAWRRQGFMVHEFSYDWRKPLSDTARRLDAFLRDRRQARPAARFALVCHSMGCLVSAIYARQVADWRQFVDHAVLCGGPLGGSFAVMEMLSGESGTVKKLALLSLNTSVDEIRQMGAGFPGAIEILPHPDLFSRPGADVERLYRRESYASFARPGADWLLSSRVLKETLRQSSLLGRSTCLVCIDRPTATTFVVHNGEARRSPVTARGDGTVAAVSAIVPGVPAYRADHRHAELMSDPKVLDAVPRILRDERLPIDPVTPEALRQPLPEAPAPTVEALEANWRVEAAAIRDRMRKGVATVDDLRWLVRDD